MADRRISELPVIPAVAGDDALAIVDTSLSETNKVSVENLLRSAPAGTAAAPSIAFVDDPDSGFYRSAANELSISTAGSQRVVVDDAGNVGIGVSNPQTLLHVESSSDGEIARFQRTGGSNLPILQVQVSEANNTVALAATGATPPDLFFTAGGSERMRIDSSGNVGIGVSNPSEKLEVNGTIKATDINFTGLATYADDTAAGTGGLVAGDVYKTSTGELRIKL